MNQSTTGRTRKSSLNSRLLSSEESRPLQPLVTVGIPVYNGEKTIAETLNSVFNQTYENIHILIVDNASEDNTEAICKELCGEERDSSYVKRDKNVGLMKNFERLVELAKGEYFIFLSADDFIDPDYISKCVAVHEEKNDLVLVGGNYKAFSDSQGDGKSFVFKGCNLKEMDDVSRVLKSFRLSPIKNATWPHINFHGVYKLEKLRKIPKLKKKPMGYAYDMITVLSAAYLGPVEHLDNTNYNKRGGGVSSDSHKLIKDFDLPPFSPKYLVYYYAVQVYTYIVKNKQFFCLSEMKRRIFAFRIAFKIAENSNRTGRVKVTKVIRFLSWILMNYSEFKRGLY
jgi:glycosyltransferase involved in cell wall biosynthesis